MSEVDWFESEIAFGKDIEGYHLFEAVDASENPHWDRLPEDYRAFLASYGRCSLFRDLDHGWHPLDVVEPEEVRPGVVKIASYYGEDFCFRKTGGTDWHDSKVYRIGIAEPFTPVAASFEPWLKQTIAEYKAGLSAERTKEITRGFEDFTEQECRMIEARKQFRVSSLGPDLEKSTLILEVTNGSDQTLSLISVPIRGNAMQGQIVIDVSCLHPGETTRHSIPSSRLYGWAVDQIELVPFVFSPRPCERAMYSEFETE